MTDPAEVALGKPVTELDPNELVTYLKKAMEIHHGITLMVEDKGLKERAVMTQLRKVYKDDAGRILQYAVVTHNGEDDKGKPLTFFSFVKERKWFTDMLHAGLQSDGNLDTKTEVLRAGFMDPKLFEAPAEIPEIPLTKIMNKILPEAEATRLYQSNPQLRADSDDYCPTCNKTGKYYWGGKSNVCDCEVQLHLHKHYQAAGIGVIYQRLSWADYQGDEALKGQIFNYLEGHSLFVSRGLGMIVHGTFGVGKTMAVTLLLKDLVKLGYDCYSTTFSSMIEMFTAGWKESDDRKYFERRIMYSDVLLLDELGREYKTGTKLSESTFDHVLRRRVQSGRPTFITTNQSLAELGKGYGASAMSMLMEVSIEIEVVGEDYRTTSGSRLQQELNAGSSRPIF